jgi:hypothetical protein
MKHLTRKRPEKDPKKTRKRPEKDPKIRTESGPYYLRILVFVDNRPFLYLLQESHPTTCGRRYGAALTAAPAFSGGLAVPSPSSLQLGSIVGVVHVKGRPRHEIAVSFRNHDHVVLGVMPQIDSVFPSHTFCPNTEVCIGLVLNNGTRPPNSLAAVDLQGSIRLVVTGRGHVIECGFLSFFDRKSLQTHPSLAELGSVINKVRPEERVASCYK